MIKVEHLTKKYGRIFALRDVSFEIESGEIVGFLGPNGAGKTTTMNILTGYLSSTAGSVSIDGFDVLETPSQAKARLGYLPEQPPLYLDMTVNEYLSFLYDLKGCLLPKEKHLSDICALTGIEKVRGRLIGNLSKGYRQRVGIAQALVCDPPVLILDEPTTGLDPNQIVEIRSLIKKLGVSHTILLSSHILSEVQAICDRVLVLDRGRLVADSRTGELGKALGGASVSITVDADRKDMVSLLSGIKGVEKAVSRGTGPLGICFDLYCPDNKEVRKNISDALAKENITLLEMKSASMSLEDIFMSLTSGDTERE